MYHSSKFAERTESIRRMPLQDNVAIKIMQIAGEALCKELKSNGIHREQEKQHLEENYS